MSEMVAELPTFIVPLQRSKLLLPNASVAEIIPYEPLQRIQDTPDWFLGLLGWRGVQVPVISIEMLTVARSTFSLVSVSSASLVVVRGVTDSENVPYFAIVAQTLPHLVRLSADALHEIAEEPAGTELARARLGDDIVAIPDLGGIGRMIEAVGFFDGRG